MTQRHRARARHFLASLLLLCLSLLTTAAFADDRPHHRPLAWGPTHPVAIGGRTLVRGGDGYVQAGLGGMVRLRPFDLVRVELYFDNYFGQNGDAIRHDHEVGTSLQLALIHTPRFTAYPLVGACAMLAMLEPGQGNPGVSDVRFGVHAGIGAELALGEGFALLAQVETVGYVGHPMTAYSWTARVERNMAIYGVGEGLVALNYWF